jgi:prepilin-type N-terminal cleavage/methylation domain-containing protein/prepilin-type processing-associated H-X9-DG protein
MRPNICIDAARRAGEIRQPPRAFTLIELLVVVSILALLISILLPGLRKAREQGKRTACLANLRALGQGMYLYSDDHNDLLPNGNPPGQVGHPQGSTDVLLSLNQRYLRSPGTFRCPADSDPTLERLTTADYDVPDSARLSYDFYSVWWLPEYGPRLTRIRHAPLAWDLKGGRERKHYQQNHGTSGGNVVFADGHGNWQPRPQWDRDNWPDPADEFYRP